MEKTSSKQATQWRGKWLTISALIIGIDQITKYLSAVHLGEGNLKIFPGFDLTLRYNTGASFNFLADASGWQRWFFIALALVISAVIIVWLGKLSKKEKWESFALSLILGGAIGNVMDRIVYGHVIDFILLYYKKWEFPAFNIADSAITVGVILLIPILFKKE